MCTGVDIIFKKSFEGITSIRLSTNYYIARCGYTLRVTSQASYSPEYITPTQKKSKTLSFKILNEQKAQN